MTRKLTVEEVLKAEEDWNGREDYPGGKMDSLLTIFHGIDVSLGKMATTLDAIRHTLDMFAVNKAWTSVQPRLFRPSISGDPPCPPTDSYGNPVPYCSTSTVKGGAE